MIESATVLVLASSSVPPIQTEWQNNQSWHRSLEPSGPTLLKQVYPEQGAQACISRWLLKFFEEWTQQPGGSLYQCFLTCPNSFQLAARQRELRSRETWIKVEAEKISRTFPAPLVNRVSTFFINRPTFSLTFFPAYRQIEAFCLLSCVFLYVFKPSLSVALLMQLLSTQAVLYLCFVICLCFCL